MAIYALDTVSFSRLMERQPYIVARARDAMRIHLVVVPAVVRGEVRYGLKRMPRGRRRSRLEATADNLFALFPCVSVSENVADAYADLKAAAEQQGTPLDENDLWIAASALATGACVVSSDTDFRRAPGLEVEDWTE